MIPVLLKKQAYKLDKDAVESGYISEDQLLDNAGFSIACHVLEKFKNPFNLKIGIIVGKGNNGGDGIIAHYYLSQWNCSSKLILIDKTIKTSLIFSKYNITSDEIMIYNDNINFIEPQKYNSDIIIRFFTDDNFNYINLEKTPNIYLSLQTKKNIKPFLIYLNKNYIQYSFKEEGDYCKLSFYRIQNFQNILYEFVENNQNIINNNYYDIIIAFIIYYNNI